METSCSTKPFLIGISGGSASGKAEACQKVSKELLDKAKGKHLIVLPLASFYNQLSDADIKLAQSGKMDLDHPNAFDFDGLADVLRKILNGESVTLSVYDPTVFSSTPQKVEIPAGIDIVIVEGILTFYQKEIRDMFHMKIFVEADADTRLSRKVLRDVLVRKRSLSVVLENYFNFVKPAFEQFCLPTKKYADVILPRAPDNTVGVELIIEHLVTMMSTPYLLSPGSFNPEQRLRLRNQSESASAKACIRPH